MLGMVPRNAALGLRYPSGWEGGGDLSPADAMREFSKTVTDLRAKQDSVCIHLARLLAW